MLAVLATGCGIGHATSDPALERASIGTNRAHLSSSEAVYRLHLDGTAALAAHTRLPAAPTTSADGRFDVSIRWSAAPVPLLTMVDRRSGQRRPFGYSLGSFAWSPVGHALMLGRHVGHTSQLLVVDAATGRVRVLSDRLCRFAGDAWSPAGNLLAIEVAQRRQSCLQAELLEIVDISHGPSRVIARVARTNLVTWTRDSRSLLVRNAGLELINAHTGRAMAHLDCCNGVSAGVWSADGLHFASQLGPSAGVDVLDHTLRHLEHAFPIGENSLPAWSTSGSDLAVATSATITLYDAAAGRILARVPVRTPYGFQATLAWSRDGRSVLADVWPGLGHD